MPGLIVEVQRSERLSLIRCLGSILGMKRALDTLLISLIFSLTGLGIIIYQFDPFISGWYIKLLFFILLSVAFVSLVSTVIFHTHKMIRNGNPDKIFVSSFRRAVLSFIFFASVLGLNKLNYNIYIVGIITLAVVGIAEALFIRAEKRKQIINDFS